MSRFLLVTRSVDAHWLATTRNASFGALSFNGQLSHSLRLHQPNEHVSTAVTIRGLHSLVTTNRLLLGVGGLLVGVLP